MAKTMLLEDKKISGFAYDEEFLAYVYNYSGNSPFSLEVGQTYEVHWDSDVYTCTAYSNSTLGYPIVCIGNGTQINGINNNEPFLIVYTPSANWLSLFAINEEPDHIVGVYLITDSNTGDIGIVLYDHSGNRQKFFGKKVIRIPTTDSGTRDFVHANLVEKTIDLDFSGGNMIIEPNVDEAFNKVNIQKPEMLVSENIRSGVTIGGIEGDLDVHESVETTVNLDFSSGDIIATPAEGQTFSKVNIPVPANLIPGNIAEGVDIAGIIGTFAGGGSGGDVKVITKVVTLPQIYTNTTVELISASELEEAGLTFPTNAYCFALMFTPNRLDELISQYVTTVAMCVITNQGYAFDNRTTNNQGTDYGSLTTLKYQSGGYYYTYRTGLKNNFFTYKATNGLCYSDGAIKFVVDSSTYLKKKNIVIAGYVEKT